MTSNDTIELSAPSLSWLHRTVRCFSGFSDYLDQKGIEHPFDAEQLAAIEAELSIIAQDIKTKVSGVGNHFESAAQLIESDEERYSFVTIPKDGDWRASITGNIQSEEWQDVCRLEEMLPNDEMTFIRADGAFASNYRDFTGQKGWFDKENHNEEAEAFINKIKDELELIIM